MLAFVLPLVWWAGVPIGLRLLTDISKAIGLFSLVIDSQKMTRLAHLGLDPEVWKAHENDLEQAFISELKREPFIFDVPREYVDLYPFLDGTFFLFKDEKEIFFDGLRHICLRDGVGKEANDLKALIAGTGISYSDLSFLWDDFSFDVEKFRKLSKRRLADDELKKLEQI